MAFFGTIDNSWGGFTTRHTDTGNPFQTGWSHDLGIYNLNTGGAATYWIIAGGWTIGDVGQGYNVSMTTITPRVSSNLNYPSKTHFGRTSLDGTDWNGIFCSYSWHTSSATNWIRSQLIRSDANSLSPRWSTAYAANSNNANVQFFDFF